MTLRVGIEDLVASGTAVTGHGEDLALACAATDADLHAARPGCQGCSGIALTALVDQWSELGRAVVVRLSDVAEALIAGAQAFRFHEQGGSEDLDSLS